MYFLFIKIYLGTNKQGPQKLSFLNSLKIRIPFPPKKHGNVPSEIASLSNFRWQNCKERPKQFQNNGDMVDKAKRGVVSELVSIWHLSNHREAE